MIKIPCEVYSRVVGYFRPVDQWNQGKQAEFAERKIPSPETVDKSMERMKFVKRTDHG